MSLNVDMIKSEYPDTLSHNQCKLNQAKKNQILETDLTSTYAKSANVKALVFSSFFPFSFPATTSTTSQKQQLVLIIINFVYWVSFSGY